MQSSSSLDFSVLDDLLPQGPMVGSSNGNAAQNGYNASNTNYSSQQQRPQSQQQQYYTQNGTSPTNFASMQQQQQMAQHHQQQQQHAHSHQYQQQMAHHQQLQQQYTAKPPQQQQQQLYSSYLPSESSVTPFQLHEIVLVDAKKFHEEYRWWAGYIEELPSDTNKQYKVRFLWTQEFAHMPSSAIRKFNLPFAFHLLERGYSLEDPQLLENILRGIRLAIQEVKGKCDYCGEVGELLLCDGYSCTRVCHAECLPKVYDQSETEGSSEMWLCNECEEVLERIKEDDTLFTTQNYWNAHFALKRSKIALESMIEDLKNQQMLRNVRIMESKSQDPNYIPHPQELRVTEHLEQKIQEITDTFTHIMEKKRNSYNPEEEDFERLKRLARDLKMYEAVGSPALMVDKKHTLKGAPSYEKRKRPAPFPREELRPTKRVKKLFEGEEEEEEEEGEGEDEEDAEFDVNKADEAVGYSDSESAADDVVEEEDEIGEVVEEDEEDVLDDDDEDDDDEDRVVSRPKQQQQARPQHHHQQHQQHMMLPPQHHHVPQQWPSITSSNAPQQQYPSAQYGAQHTTAGRSYQDHLNFLATTANGGAGNEWAMHQQQQQQQQQHAQQSTNAYQPWMQAAGSANQQAMAYAGMQQRGTQQQQQSFFFPGYQAPAPQQQSQQQSQEHVNSEDIW